MTTWVPPIAPCSNSTASVSRFLICLHSGPSNQMLKFARCCMPTFLCWPVKFHIPQHTVPSLYNISTAKKWKLTLNQFPSCFTPPLMLTKWSYNNIIIHCTPPRLLQYRPSQCHKDRECTRHCTITVQYD